MRRIFGYIRLTIKEQNDNTYMARLLEAGVPENQIYIEKITNTNSDCPSFRQLISMLNSGDTLFVVSLCHLGKNSDEVKER